MPPEILQCPAKKSSECNKDPSRPTYDTRCDVWSVGVLAWEVTAGGKCTPGHFSSPLLVINRPRGSQPLSPTGAGLSPFYDRTEEMIRTNIVEKKAAPPRGMSPELQNFVSQCLIK